jgi:hypothetical protein
MLGPTQPQAVVLPSDRSTFPSQFQSKPPQVFAPIE